MVRVPAVEARDAEIVERAASGKDRVDHAKDRVADGHEGALGTPASRETAVRAGRDAARPQETVPEQLGDPLRVADIRLSAGHRLQVGGVGQEQFEAVLE